ncbi:MAG: hypothetical protein EBU46_17930, partial [Nitrosomonadaceae bacterium]|nr:hypothetical protein [Nitrosomonadaceae bacterium]
NIRTWFQKAFAAGSFRKYDTPEMRAKYQTTLAKHKPDSVEYYSAMGYALWQALSEEQRDEIRNKRAQINDVAARNNSEKQLHEVPNSAADENRRP